MNKQIQKLSLLVTGFGLILFSFVVNAKDDFDLAKVSFLDVGQGDAIYIRLADETDILIDGGPDKNILSQLGEVMPFWDRNIDIVVLTHPHADHVTGLVEVLRRYNVGQVYYTGVLHTAPDYLAFLEEIKLQNIPLFIVDHPFDLDFANETELKFLYPNKSFVNKKVSELNNTSIVNQLIVGDNKVLLMGDSEVEVEEELLKENLDLKSNVLKVGHHGSNSSSSMEFLEAVNPDDIVIQVGEGNSFNHPHLETLEKLNSLGLNIFRNDLDGLIEFRY